MRSKEVDDHIVRSESRMLRISDLPPPEDRMACWELGQHHGARNGCWIGQPRHLSHSGCHGGRRGEDEAALWILDRGKSFINHQDETLKLDREPLDARTWQNRLAEEAIASKKKVPSMMETSWSLLRAVAEQSVVTNTGSCLLISYRRPSIQRDVGQDSHSSRLETIHLSVARQHGDQSQQPVCGPR